MGHVIEAIGVTRVYETGGVPRRALDEVTLSVAEGELVAVTGPSGSGKSTLLNVLGGIDRSYAGTVRLGGMALERCDDDQLAAVRRRRYGFVFQAFNLVPVLSALENVALPGIIDGRPAAECERRARHLLARLGLEAAGPRRPAELSGGEQQRVAVARALFLEPDVLLADEPTGNLDSVSGRAVLDALCAANRELRRTVVLVTHDPGAAAVADRVVTLRDGSLVPSVPDRAARGRPLVAR